MVYLMCAFKDMEYSYKLFIISGSGLSILALKNSSPSNPKDDISYVLLLLLLWMQAVSPAAQIQKELNMTQSNLNTSSRDIWT